MTFGQLFKEFRIKSGRTLRQFCIEHGFDHSVISKLERGLVRPEFAKLEAFAKALHLRPESSEWREFFSAAAEFTPSCEQLLDKLPVLGRFTGKELDKFIEKVREA